MFLTEEDMEMGRKRHTAEEIVSKLRQVDVLTAQGQAVVDAIQAIGVTEVTYYRWRNEYGGLKGDQVKRLKELETENGRLRRAVSDLTLDKLILTEAIKLLRRRNLSPSTQEFLAFFVGNYQQDTPIELTSQPKKRNWRKPSQRYFHCRSN
jgi:transposase-like protein